MSDVVGYTNDTVALVEKIASASNHQATEVSKVVEGIEVISDVVQTNSATAQQSAAGSEELSSQSQILKDLVGNFKLKDDSENF